MRFIHSLSVALFLLLYFLFYGLVNTTFAQSCPNGGTCSNGAGTCLYDGECGDSPGVFCNCSINPDHTPTATPVPPTATSTPVPATNTPAPQLSCSDCTDWSAKSCGDFGCESDERRYTCTTPGLESCIQCRRECTQDTNPPPAATSTPVPGGGDNNPPATTTAPTATPVPTCPTLTKPKNLIATCDAQGNTILKWDAVEGAQYYSVRVDSATDNYNWDENGCPADSTSAVTNGFCIDEYAETTLTFKSTTKDAFGWWVHARCGNVGDWANAPAEFGNGISCARPDKPILSSQVPVCSADGWSADFSWQKPQTDPRVDNFIFRLDLKNDWLMAAAQAFAHWFMFDGSDMYHWTGNVLQQTASVIPFRTYEGWSIQSMISSDPSTAEMNADATTSGNSFMCIPEYTPPSEDTSNCLDDVGNLSENCTVDNFIDEYKRQYGYDTQMANTARGNPYPNLVQGKNAYGNISDGSNTLELIDLLDYEALRYTKYNPVATLTPTATPTTIPPNTPTPTTTPTNTPTPRPDNDAG